MSGKSDSGYWRFSFYTRSILVGWSGDNKPIWNKLISYDEKRMPIWKDWEEVREHLIAPLCRLAESVVLYGNQWLSDVESVSKVKRMVEGNFQMVNQKLVCDSPIELVDESFFWTGGSSACFHLMQVMVFDMDAFESVLNSLRWHELAAQNSLRTGGDWTRINNFAKKVVEADKFIVVQYGHESELFCPINMRETVEEYGNGVMERVRERAKKVDARINQSGA